MHKACDGVRAELPADMSHCVHRLIRQCWADKPEDRPAFAEIMAELRRIRYKIHPGIDSSAVEQFIAEARPEADQNLKTEF
jgi:hypothetical protein